MHFKIDYNKIQQQIQHWNNLFKYVVILFCNITKGTTHFLFEKFAVFKNKRKKTVTPYYLLKASLLSKIKLSKNIFGPKN